MVWQSGVNEVYSRVPAQASLGECPVGMAFHPKAGSVGWDHLMHTIEVGGEVA